MNNFSRATSALVVMASLLLSSVAAVGQTTTQTQQAEPPAVPVLKKTPAQDAKTQTPTTATQQAEKKTDRATPNITTAKKPL